MNDPILYISVIALLGIFGITFKLVLQRMDKQEERAASDVITLRQEIANTKADATAAVNAAQTASKDAVAATAKALSDSVAATALASKEQVAASAAALKDQVSATAIAAKDNITEKASSLKELIDLHNGRIDRLENLLLSKKDGGGK